MKRVNIDIGFIAFARRLKIDWTHARTDEGWCSGIIVLESDFFRLVHAKNIAMKRGQENLAAKRARQWRPYAWDEACTS